MQVKKTLQTKPTNVVGAGINIICVWKGVAYLLSPLQRELLSLFNGKSSEKEQILQNWSSPNFFLWKEMSGDIDCSIKQLIVSSKDAVN